MPWQWLERRLLIPRLRCGTQMRAFKRAYATLYAIECSSKECADVAAIGRPELIRLGSGMQHYLGITDPIPRIRVLCFGTSARLKEAPSVIRHWTSAPFGGGVWLRELRTAIGLFDGCNPIRRIVIHELAHALIDLLTDAFPYPLAITEGFARRAELLLPDHTGAIEWERQSRDAGGQDRMHLTDNQCMSVKELVFFDASKYWRHDMKAFVEMTNLSFWMNVYLFKLSDHHPRLAHILRELRVRNLRTSETVYTWLQEVSGMQENELEESFHKFCTTGVISSEHTHKVEESGAVSQSLNRLGSKWI